MKMKAILRESPDLAAGWVLVAIMAIVALLPWTTLAVVVVKLVVVASLALYVWLVTRRKLSDKVVSFRISGVPEEEREGRERAIVDALGDRATLSRASYASGELAVTVKTRQTLATLTRRLRKTLKTLMTTEATLKYALSDAEAGLEVTVSGHAAPNARVVIEGLEEPIRADVHGRFKAKVPYDLVRTHEHKGYIPARWERGQASDSLKIRIPAA